MTFRNTQSMRAPSRRATPAPVYCVGSRAFVNWHSSDPSVATKPVPATDPHGKSIETDFVDGDEVEVLAWRPRGREGASYQVRRLRDGNECWLWVDILRTTRQPASTAA
ncbi:MAG TPA: hypothetical protein VEB21_01200 [Terriglobales bacterium]|nr:hypothetical protein [Terriglobales bacterium]